MLKGIVKMERKIMNLTKISELNDISADYLTQEYGYRAFNGGHITIVNSAPNIIYFGKGEFLGSFSFNQNVLIQITLVPIVPGVKAPNYPSEEYQNAKKEYCVSILRDIYGNETASNEFGTSWERENVIIVCHVILDGKAQYTGGDIVIRINEPGCLCSQK